MEDRWEPGQPLLSPEKDLVLRYTLGDGRYSKYRGVCFSHDSKKTAKRNAKAEQDFVTFVVTAIPGQLGKVIGRVNRRSIAYTQGVRWLEKPTTEIVVDSINRSPFMFKSPTLAEFQKIVTARHKGKNPWFTGSYE